MSEHQVSLSRLQEAGYAVRPVADLCAEALVAANDAARDALIRAQTAEARVAELEAALLGVKEGGAAGAEDGQPCWCPALIDCTHADYCMAARAALGLAP